VEPDRIASDVLPQGVIVSEVVLCLLSNHLERVKTTRQIMYHISLHGNPIATAITRSVNRVGNHER
jgi:hypothetical protein